MENILDRLVTEPIQDFFNRVISFLPNLLSAVFVLIIGLVAAWAAKHILIRFFRIMKVDDFSERAGISRIISKSGIRDTFSAIVARLAGWLIFFVFIIISLSSMNVPAIESLLGRFFLYLPNIFVALIIIILGYMLSNFLGRAALIASVNAGLKVSGFAGKTVKLAIFLFSLSIALEQLGIGKDTVVLTFAIIFGGIVLALAIAFGLGGRDAAKSYLEGKLLKEEEKDDISHL